MTATRIMSRFGPDRDRKTKRQTDREIEKRHEEKDQMKRIIEFQYRYI